MFAVYGYSDPKNADSALQKLSSSYQLKQGDRPGGNAPDGKYDGTFVRDDEFVAASGDLDEYNGRNCKRWLIKDLTKYSMTNSGDACEAWGHRKVDRQDFKTDLVADQVDRETLVPADARNSGTS